MSYVEPMSDASDDAVPQHPPLKFEMVLWLFQSAYRKNLRINMPRDFALFRAATWVCRIILNDIEIGEACEEDLDEMLDALSLPITLWYKRRLRYEGVDAQEIEKKSADRTDEWIRKTRILLMRPEARQDGFWGFGGAGREFERMCANGMRPKTALTKVGLDPKRTLH